MRTIQRVLPLILATVACSADLGTVPDGPDIADVTPIFDRIIYTSIHPDSHYMAAAGLWTAAPDGSDRRLLIGGRVWPGSPSVSPDGKWVVFEDGWKLYLVDAEGGNLTELGLPAGVRGTLPKWSPNGDWILFTYQDGAGGPNRIARIAPDGSALTPLTSIGKPDSWAGSWSPDGNSIVFVRQVYPDPMGPPVRWIVSMDLATQVESVLIDSTGGFTGYHPSWSPDGGTLYLLDLGPDEEHDWLTEWVIGRYDVTSGDYTLIGSAKGNRPGTLSPDGTTLLFGSSDLWTAAPDGSGRAPIVADGRQNFEAFWTPTAPSP
jgi:Tol biopolymer transport system component